jgi:hypothetical protein
MGIGVGTSVSVGSAVIVVHPIEEAPPPENP